MGDLMPLHRQCSYPLILDQLTAWVRLGDLYYRLRHTQSWRIQAPLLLRLRV